MKQKLALAQVFADPVQILILDEPTSALDPSARGIVLELIQEARSHGQTVIFSGHVLAEVEQVADRVAIMRRGRLDACRRHACRGEAYASCYCDSTREWSPFFPSNSSSPSASGKMARFLLEHQGDLPLLLA